MEHITSTRLRADATTSNDNLANASLPGHCISANIRPSSANGTGSGTGHAASDVCKRSRRAAAGRMMGSSRLILRCHFSSADLPARAASTRSVRSNMKLMRSIGLGSRLGGQWQRSSASGFVQLVFGWPQKHRLPRAHAISRSMAA